MAKRIDRSTPLFQVTDLCQYFNVGRGKVLKAVDHVHFTMYKGETLGLLLKNDEVVFMDNFFRAFFAQYGAHFGCFFAKH